MAKLIASVMLVIILVYTHVLFLRKSGRSGWWAGLLVFTWPFGLPWLGLTEWPIEREVSWRRLRDGEHTEDDIARVEAKAIDHEL